MKTIPIYQADAFADSIFLGNPAAVCILEEWLPEEVMQQIGRENNLSETAFLVREGDAWCIRWFSPAVEIDLCGHATLASAYILFHFVDTRATSLVFKTRKRGKLQVEKSGDYLFLNFPADIPMPTQAPPGLFESIGGTPIACYKGLTDYLIEYGSEEEVRMLRPDFKRLAAVEARGICVTAPGDVVDFVSRFFAPQSGIDEDPVTGSAHTMLIPFWSERLRKNEMSARQISARGGALKCRHEDTRVIIGGKVQLYMQGEMFIPEAV